MTPRCPKTVGRWICYLFKKKESYSPFNREVFQTNGVYLLVRKRHTHTRVHTRAHKHKHTHVHSQRSCNTTPSTDLFWSQNSLSLHLSLTLRPRTFLLNQFEDWSIVSLDFMVFQGPVGRPWTDSTRPILHPP